MNSELKVQWNSSEYEYYVVVPIDNQKLKVAISFYDYSDTTMYGNIYVQLYTKRKHRQRDMDNCIMTGLNPIKTVYYGIKAFKLLEDAALRGYNEDYIVNLSCSWTNSTRRDACITWWDKLRFKWITGYEYEEE